jgi:methylmalonyl-CoA mutase C-terminal domain/subunit
VEVPGELLSRGSVRVARVLVAKTSLDGHWRGINVVARALRDGGFEVILAGMVSAQAIARVAADEDIDLIGLNIGGRVEVADRVLDTLRDAGIDIPVFAGGTIPPYAAERLRARGVECFPPGSSLKDIVDAARRLTAGVHKPPTRTAEESP